MHKTIYHITTRDAWQHAHDSGMYRAPSLESEGFIHCSTAAQVVPVANALYPGQADLVLLAINPAGLAAALRWEPPAHPNPDDPVPAAEHDLFPHVYGPINTSAVTRALDFPPGEDGRFTLPESVN